MNKYVIRTSAVWIVVLLLVTGLLIHRSKHDGSAWRWPLAHSQPASGELQPEAEGPAPSGHPQPARTPDGAAEGETAAPLAPLQLTPERMQSIGVQTGEVLYKQVGGDVRATGNVDVDDRLVSYVQVRFPGYIRKVFVNATYQYVRAGQPLFTVYSPELVATQQELLLARQNQRTLGTSTVDGVAAGADALAGAAEHRLRQWEIPQAEVNKIKSSGQTITDLTINSPASGYVTERNALPNLYAEPSTRLYTIADLSRVWVNAQVFQDDLGKLKPGDRAQVTLDAFPGQIFGSRIEAVLPQVDLATRTARVRLALQNPGLKLKPGMFVNVSFQTAVGRSLVIPASAVLQSGSRQLAFLDRGNGSLEPKDVVLGARVGDDYIVLQGLKEHDRVVTSASFLIDSESQLEAAAGSFTPPPPGVGANAQTNPATRTQDTVDLTTDPNPAKKGTNTFKAKVTDPSGAVVAGAEVTVKFYMPAMPAMGMAAMQMTTRLGDKGGGNYEGTGTLDSGGTWQVTVTVQKNGQTLAVKQMRINATGGM